MSATGTAPAALAAAFEATNREDTVSTAVGLGGDTDTLACIAGAVAEARFGVPAAVADRARDYLTPDLQAVIGRFELEIEVRPPEGGIASSA